MLKDNEEILARNIRNAHAQDVVMNDELLLPVLRTFAQ